METKKWLIDARYVIRKLQEEQSSFDTVVADDNPFLKFKKRAIPKLLQNVIDYIASIPTVEAVEVVHGRWIYDEEPDEDNNIGARCSVCFAGDKHATALMHKVPYCSNCGAKMDGDSK